MLLKCVVSYLCVFVCVCVCTTIYIDDYYNYVFYYIMLDIGERAFEFMFLVVMPHQ